MYLRYCSVACGELQKVGEGQVDFEHSAVVSHRDSDIIRSLIARDNIDAMG